MNQRLQDKLYEKYFGSSTIVKEYDGELIKETIKEYDQKSYAKMAEFYYNGNKEMTLCA